MLPKQEVETGKFYSSTVVDPVNDVDFWTIQEYAAAHSTDPLRGWWDSHDRFATWFDRVNSQKTPPIVITNMITSVTAFSATGGGNVTDDGGATVWGTERDEGCGGGCGLDGDH